MTYASIRSTDDGAPAAPVSTAITRGAFEGSKGQREKSGEQNASGLLQWASGARTGSSEAIEAWTRSA